MPIHTSSTSIALLVRARLGKLAEPRHVRHGIIAAGGVLALTLGVSACEIAAQSSPRVIWRGIHTDVRMGPDCNWQLVETFEFVGEPRAGGADPQWRSRKVTWNYGEACAREVIVLEETDGDPATPKRRVHRPWTRSCENRGEADLNLVPDPRQEGTCQENIHVMGPRPTLTAPSLGWTGPRPESQMRDGCAYAARSRQIDHRGNVRVITFSVTRTGDVDAVVEVDRHDYDGFVPVPGRTLTFTAKSSRPARFRFELDADGTSRFAGYASNAYIDDLFFVKHPTVRHLKGNYLDDDPDVIFDPARFPQSAWSRAEYLVVETAQPHDEVGVTVTAMDYGAVGRLRAFMKSEDCGGIWLPVRVGFGTETRESVNIPLDEDDNLMADALEDYHFLASGADDDAEPKGDGTAGDGLTAFEEYRGFIIRGADCGESATALQEVGAVPTEVPGASQEHVRSPPHHKNVFVFADDPLLATLVGEFGWAANLSALAICETGYAGNDVRIVNYTLHESGGPPTWRGHTVLLEEPQHGLWLKRVDDTSVPGLSGLTVGVAPDVMGPPKLTIAVEIAKPLFDPGCRVACGPGRQDVMITVRHELGHAVGVPHHGDDVLNWRVVTGLLDISAELSPRQRAGGPPDFARVLGEGEGPDALLVEPGPSCTSDADDAAFSDEALTAFVGCLAANIVRRGQQHSGDMWCPMRYPYGDRYEVPGAAVRYLWSGAVHHPRLPGKYLDRNVQQVRVDAWGGPVLKYQNQIDDANPPLRRYCTKPLATGINAGELDHAGDNSRQRPCGDFVVVKDSAAPSMQ